MEYISQGTLPIIFVIVNKLLVASADNSSQFIIERIFDGYNEKASPSYGSGCGILIMIPSLPSGLVILVTGETKVVINMTILIVSMYSIKESSMEFSISLFLRQFWYDKRLEFQSINYQNLTRLELDPHQKNIWVPDVYVLNEKSAHFHDVTVPNRLVHIYPNGRIQYVVRITGAFSCQMWLQKYPFDSQECFLEFESFGRSTDNLDFEWVKNPVDRTMALDFPQFTLVYYTPYICTRDYYGIKYPCLGVKFFLRRNYGYHIIQIYIPSVLIVVLSWLNFWLDCMSVPARISLGLLTVLTMTTQLSGARVDLPPVSYIKAIDVWMAACLTFVVCALVEFSYVNVLARAGLKYTSDLDIREDTRREVPTTFKTDLEGWTRRLWCSSNLSGLDKAVMVDKISRVLFPLAFIIFNIVYWLVYVVL